MKVITRAEFQWDGEKYVLVSEDSYTYDGPVAECKKPKAPAAPDPNVVANAQNQQNQQAANYNAALNRTNTYTPYGSQEYSVSGTDPRTGAPIYRQDIKLDPQLEQAYRQQLSQNLQLGDAAGSKIGEIQGQSPFSLSGLPEISGDYEGLRKQQSDAVYGRQAAYLDPQFKQGEDALRSRLANQGVVEGTEAYTNAMGDFNRGKEFSYGQARDSAVAAGGQEADRAYGQQLSTRNQMLSEYLTGRQQPYSELAQLRGLSPVDMPQFQGMSEVGINPSDITGAIGQQYQGQMDAYNAKVQQRNALLQGAASVGGAFLLSDENAKDNIEPIGTLNDGTGLFSFTYKGSNEPQVGVMAQDVEKRDPSAVRVRPDGYKEVNYQRVLSRALAA
jgi:hypothetical protein